MNGEGARKQPYRIREGSGWSDWGLISGFVVHGRSCTLTAGVAWSPRAAWRRAHCQCGRHAKLHPIQGGGSESTPL